MIATEETAVVETAEPDLHDLAARINVRLAQLGWPVVAEVETAPDGSERLLLRRTSTDDPDRGTAPMRVGATSLGRSNLLESILSELRARGWNRPGSRPAPRADVLWCAPA